MCALTNLLALGTLFELNWFGVFPTDCTRDSSFQKHRSRAVEYSNHKLFKFLNPLKNLTTVQRE